MPRGDFTPTVAMLFFRRRNKWRGESDLRMNPVAPTVPLNVPCVRPLDLSNFPIPWMIAYRTFKTDCWKPGWAPFRIFPRPLRKWFLFRVSTGARASATCSADDEVADLLVRRGS